MHRHRQLTVTSVVAVASCALLTAGCGGGGSPRVANVASSSTTATTTTSQRRPVAFARCMRSNGVSNYPDVGKPTPQQAGVSRSRFETSLNACKQLLPNGGVSQETAQQKRTRLADELSFARCMRGHGVSRFPDPTAQAQLTVEMVRALGIDVHSPAVLRVVETCLPASHGGLTLAKVREAINNAGG